MYQMPDHMGTCKQMHERYGYSPSHYISYFSSAVVDIAKETNCRVSLREEGNARYWPVLFQGKYNRQIPEMLVLLLKNVKAGYRGN